MRIIPFVHEGLGNSSYLVGLPDGTALLVDPDRTAARYVAEAETRGWRIAAVLETHVHADFLTGAVELLEMGAGTVFAPADGALEYRHQPVRSGDRLRIGGVEIETIASPGHTPEHLSYVLRAGREAPALFSGGSLIVGGAARTDLISPDLTDELTRHQFCTVRDAFGALPDETLLYPTHGGGSFCSAGAASGRTSTLGEERRSNQLLRIEDEEEFARTFPTIFPAAPSYFYRMRPLNQAGPRPRAQIPPPPPLPPLAFKEAMEGAMVIDVRPVKEYSAAHVPGSLSIPFRDSYATWLGWLVEHETPLLFVLGDVPLEAVLDESLLVGYESLTGILDGGIEAWQREGLQPASIGMVSPEAVTDALADGAVAVDVREPSEYPAGGIDGALKVPLGELRARVQEIPPGRPVLTYCGAGLRASTAASILEQAGRSPIFNLRSGGEPWRRVNSHAR